MADYQKMYAILCGAIDDTLTELAHIPAAAASAERLTQALQRAETLYIESSEPPILVFPAAAPEKKKSPLPPRKAPALTQKIEAPGSGDPLWDPLRALRLRKAPSARQDCTPFFEWMLHPLPGQPAPKRQPCGTQGGLLSAAWFPT